ncbi:MAG: hypothetical protein CW346_17730 [Bacillaceae bacterium]|nr:hypothetical protein [Bacillaceae bacterium]
MDVEQTIRILRLLREGCAVWPSDRRKAINNAIAIIKAAQEFKQAREDALDASDDNFEQAVARAEEKRDVLFSLLSPERDQKKEA